MSMLDLLCFYSYKNDIMTASLVCVVIRRPGHFVQDIGGHFGSGHKGTTFYGIGHNRLPRRQFHLSLLSSLTFALCLRLICFE